MKQIIVMDDELEEAWNNFCQGDYTSEKNKCDNNEDLTPPKCSELYISTKTKDKKVFLKLSFDLRIYNDIKEIGLDFRIQFYTISSYFRSKVN